MSPSQEPASPTTHKSQLAARLKQLRAEQGLSLSQLARATGISSSFLSLIEQAQSDITIGRLVRLAEFYDVELADLLNGPPTAPADHVRILRAAPDYMLHSPTEGVDLYDLTCGARWTLVPSPKQLPTRRQHRDRRRARTRTHDLHPRKHIRARLSRRSTNPPPLRRGRDLPQRGRYRVTNVGRGQGRVLAVRVHPEAH